MKQTDLQSVIADIAGRVDSSQLEPEQNTCCDGTGWKYNEDQTAYPCQVCRNISEMTALRSKVRASGISKDYLDTSWDDLQLTPQHERLKNASQDLKKIFSKGVSSILSGPTGSGKSQSGMLILKDAISQSFTAYACNLGEIALRIRSGYGKENAFTEHEALELMSKPDFLLIDDLGAGQAQNGSVEEKLLYLVLEYRDQNSLPTIITTNLSPSQLVGDLLGERLFSRLQPCTPIEFNHGIDFRQEKNKSESVSW